MIFPFRNTRIYLINFVNKKLSMVQKNFANENRLCTWRGTTPTNSSSKLEPDA